MTIAMPTFLKDIAITAAIHKNYPNRATELNTIASALASDGTTKDTTLQTAPAGLIPGSAANTRFTNDVLLVVNAGKAGGLLAGNMGNAITAGLSQIFPPVNTAAPAATGTGTVGQTLTVTNGTWTYVPTSYQYQWQRAGADISGANASTYVLVAADSGKSVRCGVTAINAAGVATSYSNAIAVA